MGEHQRRNHLPRAGVRRNALDTEKRYDNPTTESVDKNKRAKLRISPSEYNKQSGSFGEAPADQPLA